MFTGDTNVRTSPEDVRYMAPAKAQAPLHRDAVEIVCDELTARARARG